MVHLIVLQDLRCYDCYAWKDMVQRKAYRQLHRFTDSPTHTDRWLDGHTDTRTQIHEHMDTRTQVETRGAVNSSGLLLRQMALVVWRLSFPLEVVQQHRPLLRFLTPVTHHDARAVDHLPGAAFAVELAYRCAKIPRAGGLSAILL